MEFCFACRTRRPADPAVSSGRKSVQALSKMKKCGYCGRQNEDLARHCLECGTEFEEVPTSPVEQTPIARAEAQETVLRTAEAASEPGWVARDAWKCLGMFFVFEFVVYLAWAALEVRLPAFGRWSRTGAGHLIFSTTHDTLSLLTVLYFARTETLASFLHRFGLRRPPSDYVWFAVVVALALRSFGHVMISSGLSRGVSIRSLWGFTHSAGFERYLYLAPTLMAPFSEEVLMRGFIYRAFRGSYGIVSSTILILGVTAITHWGQVHHSWAAAVDIGALTVLQCFLRERTDTLWDCIICHMVFNASGAFASLLR